MFRVVELSYVPEGIRAVLVMDDPADLYYIKFIRNAEKFAELFHHKIVTGKKVHDRELDRPRIQAAACALRARLLTAYRELPGTRAVRIRELRRILSARGENVTTDTIVADLSMAIQEDREAKGKRIRELVKGGRSIREIARILSLPAPTVARLRANSQICPRIDDLPSPPMTTSPFIEISQPEQQEATT